MRVFLLYESRRTDMSDRRVIGVFPYFEAATAKLPIGTDWDLTPIGCEQRLVASGRFKAITYEIEMWSVEPERDDDIPIDVETLYARR